MGRTCRLQRTAQQGFYLITGFKTAILFAELHTYALRPITLRDRGNPDDLPHYFKFYRIINQAQQHEHFIADFEAFIGGDEKTAAFNKGHVGRI